MSTEHELWTIQELGEQVARALTDNYAGPANERIRAVPDLRTIRFYTTLGLIDRPAEMRGRTAFYARRHLLQLVAIKRLQARGLALAQIQQQLLGMTPAALRRLADLPAAEKAGPAARAQQAPPPPERQRFWAAAPAPVSAPTEAPAASDVSWEGAALQGIPLGDQVLLLLAPMRPLDDDDRSALRQAATPLIQLLEARRLLPPRTERGTA